MVDCNLEEEAMGKSRVFSYENMTGRTSYFDGCINDVRFFSGGYNGDIVIDKYFSFF